jgi:hypothetical protein
LALGDLARISARFEEHQPLWVLVGPDGTLLAARHQQAGLVVLSWTTREELEEGVETLYGKAPLLFVTHHPEQRPFAALLATSRRLGMRLRIDDFVVEASRAVTADPE